MPTLAVAIAGRRGGFSFEIDFTVPLHGVTALLGPSAAGKTTVLRAVAGLDRHRGSIRCGDEVWQDSRRFVAPHRRRIGYVAQGAGLLPHISVGANLRYAQRRAATGPFVADEVAAQTGIGHLLDRMPRDLSGGEARRASIARALLGQPRLLLMDEPLAGLDEDGRATLGATLATLFAAVALPVVYVTHDAGEAARLATTTIRLRDGCIDRSSG